MKTRTLCCLSFPPSSFFQILLELIDSFVNPFDFFLSLSSLTSKTPISCSTIYGQAGTQTTATRRTGYRRTARLFNIYHLLPLDATTYRGFLCHCIIELVSSRLQN